MSKMGKPGNGKRFAAGVAKLEKKGYSKDRADAVMASAGRKKYGQAQMTKWSVEARKKKGK